MFKERPFKKSRLLIGAAAIALLPTGQAWAAGSGSDVEDLKDLIKAQQEQLKAMTERLEQLEDGQKETAAKAEEAASKSAEAVTSGDFPGSMKLPGSDVSFKVGGYVKLDAIHDFNDSTGAVFVPGRLPRASNEDETRFQARESRLNVDVRTPTPFGQGRVFVEMDFFGSSGNEVQTNSHNPRLRHAFGELGSFLAGQTWTTFMDVSALPETLDFEGPNGEIFVRQPLVRWTERLDDGVSLAFALESPEGDVEGGNGTNLDRFPDGVISGRWAQDWGHLQASALFREINIDAPETTGAAGPDDSAFGYGLTVSGKVNVPTLGEKDNFKFQASYGDGIGRYIVDIGATGDGDGVIDSSGNVETLKAFGGFGAYQHWWTSNVRSTAVLGYVDVENDSAQADTALDNSLYAAANLIWSPVNWVDVGVEYLYGRGELKNGDEGTGSRIQGSAKFRF